MTDPGTFISADGSTRCRACHLHLDLCTCGDHPVREILAALGFSIESPEIARGLRWVREHRARYGIDPAHMPIASAGGAIAWGRPLHDGERRAAARLIEERGRYLMEQERKGD